MSPSIFNESSQNSYHFPNSHLSSKNSKIIPLITPLLTPITFTSIIPFLLNSSHFSFAAHSFLDHILSRTCFIISKTELQNSHKIFKKTSYPFKRSKILLKSIISIRQQILPKDISNPFYV